MTVLGWANRLMQPGCREQSSEPEASARGGALSWLSAPPLADARGSLGFRSRPPGRANCLLDRLVGSHRRLFRFVDDAAFAFQAADVVLVDHLLRGRQVLEVAAQGLQRDLLLLDLASSSETELVEDVPERR